jgi:hypothetical protein
MFTTVEDLFYNEMDNLIECLPNNTSTIVKICLKTLKKWAEDEYDLEGTLAIIKFAVDVCRGKETGMAKTSKAVQQQTE